MKWIKTIGPGLAVAATGVGAGDMVAAAVAGSKYTVAVVWAVVLGAILKYTLNEGIGRWQFATGTTLLEGWIAKLPKWVSWYFLIYLFLWTFIVSGALMSSCGIAAHSIIPAISISQWAIIHSFGGMALVYWGKYSFFEKAIKFFIGLMFGTLIISAAMILPDIDFLPLTTTASYIPKGSGKFLVGILGGVGGSVTLLSYSYWLRESKSSSKSNFRNSKWELLISYGFTGLFGIAVLLIASSVNLPGEYSGSQLILAIADTLESKTGTPGRFIFLFGFWGAVASSLLGVWQGVPYLFSDFIHSSGFTKTLKVNNLQNKYYNGYLLYLGLAPVLLLYFDKPLWVVIIYSIIGAFFMPFLAIILLILNNKKEWVGDFKNPVLINILLILSILIFGYLCVVEVLETV